MAAQAQNEEECRFVAAAAAEGAAVDPEFFFAPEELTGAVGFGRDAVISQTFETIDQGITFEGTTRLQGERARTHPDLAAPDFFEQGVGEQRDGQEEGEKQDQREVLDTA